MRFLFFIFSVCCAARAQDTGVPVDPDAVWSVFAQVKFRPQYYEKYKTHFLTPGFDSRIRIMEGKEITLRGHYIPYELPDKNSIIISRYPFSSCFFCGGAGPESVAEVVFDTKVPRLKADQIITVRGTLKLNAADVDHLNFILIHSKLVSFENP